MAWFDGQSTWREYNDTPSSYNGLQLPGTNIAAALKARADGLLCIGTVNAGFTYLTDSTVTVYTTFANDCRTIPRWSGLGQRWVALVGLSCRCLVKPRQQLVGGAWYQYSTLNSMMASNALTSIVIDGGDRKFLRNQISSGLTLFQGFSSFTTFTSANSDLPGDEIMSLALDGAGRVWVGTSNGGAARFSYAVGIDDVAAPAPDHRDQPGRRCSGSRGATYPGQW